MFTKNKQLFQKRLEERFKLMKIAREAKRERQNRLSWNI